ncbi:hypothetical protein Tsubulata_020426, partial [Turnera subulata]
RGTERATMEEKNKIRIMHYTNHHKILLVGEGDFSFSASLAMDFRSANNMVATSLDSRELLLSRYYMAATHLKQLEDRGCAIIHGVDVNNMSRHPLLCHRKFDRINALPLLANDGEVHVTHKTSYPFNEWKIKELAASAGLPFCVEKIFSVSHYMGYENKRGQGNRADESFPVGSCSTFIFSRASKLREKLVESFFSNALPLLANDGEVHVTHKTAHPFSQWNIQELAHSVGLTSCVKDDFSTYYYPGYQNKRGQGYRADETFPGKVTFPSLLVWLELLAQRTTWWPHLSIPEYSLAAKHLKELEDSGCTIIHGVDVSNKNLHPLLCHRKFDRIVFNFPHATLLWREQDSYQIETVVKDFFSNAVPLLANAGEVHVTHKTAHPFSQWKIKQLAYSAGLPSCAEEDFDLYDYPGYQNKKGQGYRADETFP